MKFLLDENIPRAVFSFLESLGHDVQNLQIIGKTGIRNGEVFGLAQAEDRILLTFDRHFGNVLVYPPEESAGIIVLRINPPTAENAVVALGKALNHLNENDFKGHLTVISKRGIRLHPKKY